MLQDQSTLIHCEHESSRQFEELTAAFEAELGRAGSEAFRDAVAASSDTEDFEARMRAFEGPSGFMLFWEADHGAWMARAGLNGRCKLYVLGNPVIARTMIQHDVGVGLNVPVRVLIYEGADGCRIAYDLPSSLMARLNNDRVTAAAKDLDAKLAALARTAAGG